MTVISTLSLFMILVGLVALGAVTVYGLDVFKKIVQVVETTLLPLTASIRFLGWYAVPLTLTLIVGSGWFIYTFWFSTGPRDLAGHRPPLCVEVLDRNGALYDYACPTEQLRLWRPLKAIDANLRALVVMLEDDKFYEHGGLDLDEIWNAIEKDIEKKKIVRGGSTITQQLAKNLFLSNEKTLVRKATEVPLALRIEKELSKDQILELYLNTIEWGPGIYGAELASRLYFDHDASTLRPEEAWLMALIIPNPKELNLWLKPKALESLLKRAQSLSTRLVQGRKMSKDEAAMALANFEAFVKVWMHDKPWERKVASIAPKPAPAPKPTPEPSEPMGLMAGIGLALGGNDPSAPTTGTTATTGTGSADAGESSDIAPAGTAGDATTTAIAAADTSATDDGDDDAEEEAPTLPKRTYPVAWDKNRLFNLGLIPPVQKQVQKIVAKKQNHVLESELDSQMQTALQTLAGPTKKDSETPPKLIVLLDGQKVRAVVPDQGTVLENALLDLARTHHVDVQRISTKAFSASNFIR